ncbi:MAG: M12 family metallopeptidase [Granulosicoccaceae bacterium]
MRKPAILMSILLLSACGGSGSGNPEPQATSDQPDVCPSDGDQSCTGSNGNVASHLRDIDVIFPGFDDPISVTVESFGDDYLFQDDVIITDPRICNEQGQCSAGAAVPNSALWPGGRIPYVIETGHPFRRQIHQAAQQISDATNVAIFERTDEREFVTIKHGGTRCAAAIGKKSRQAFAAGKQVMNLAPGCGSVGVIKHEFMHVAGIHHEQSRSDRDSFVSINWDNIKPGKKHNFKKIDTDGWWFTDLGVNGQNVGNYDFDSIMHYGSYSFAIDGTIPTIEKVPSGLISGSGTLSSGDINTINTLYRTETTPPSFTYHPDTRSSYVLESRLGNNKVIDIQGGQSTNGTNTILHSYNGTDAQVFKFRQTQDGNYRIQSSLDSDRVIDVSGGNSADGTNIQLWEANATDSQKFRLVAVDDIYFEIESALDSNKVLSLTNGETSNYTNMELSTRFNIPSQQFKLVTTKLPVAGRVYAIESMLENDLLLTSDPFQSVNDFPVKSDYLNFAENQFFLFEKKTDCTLLILDCEDYLEIKPLRAPTKLMTVHNANSANGSSVTTTQRLDSTSQRWDVNKSGTAEVEIASHLGKVLDVPGGTTVGGTTLSIFSRNNTASQRFQILETSK